VSKFAKRAGVSLRTKANYNHARDSFNHDDRARAQRSVALRINRAEALLQDIDVPAEPIDAIFGKIRNELAPARRRLTNES
jgi:hypothetical protein